MSDEQIMAAVEQALRSHGYADLTMQDIADACGKSTSLLHYHYDTKDDLLMAFLDHLLDDYERRIAAGASRPPEQRIVEFVARFVFVADDEREAVHLALLGMRSQGPYDERILNRLRRSDRLLRETAAEILADGIEEGVFDPVDPDRMAALLVATLDGARTRQSTLSQAAVSSPDPVGAHEEDGTNAGVVSLDDGDSNEAVVSFEKSDATDPVDYTYSRVVVEDVLARIVEPILAEGRSLPSLDATLADLRCED